MNATFSSLIIFPIYSTEAEESEYNSLSRLVPIRLIYIYVTSELLLIWIYEHFVLSNPVCYYLLDFNFQLQYLCHCLTNLSFDNIDNGTVLIPMAVQSARCVELCTLCTICKRPSNIHIQKLKFSKCTSYLGNIISQKKRAHHHMLSPY